MVAHVLTACFCRHRSPFDGVENYMSEEFDLNVVAVDIETVEVDDRKPGSAAIHVKLEDGRIIRLDFQPKALLALEIALGEIQIKMADDFGLQ